MKITGIRNVRLCLCCFDSKMHGLKYLDALKLKALFSIIYKREHNTLQGRRKIIDLKLSLHSRQALLTNQNHVQANGL